MVKMVPVHRKGAAKRRKVGVLRTDRLYEISIMFPELGKEV